MRNYKNTHLDGDKLIETYYPGFLLPQDTYYVRYIKGVGHIYQQTVIDNYI